MTTKPIIVKAEIKENELVEAFNSLTKAHRIRLLSELAERLAYDLSKVEKPTPESSKQTHKAWDRFTTIRMEAGNDSSMWGDEMEAHYLEQPMNDTEELIMALFAIDNLGVPVRRKLLASSANKALSGV